MDGPLSAGFIMAWFSCGGAHDGKVLVSVFQEFFASILKAFNFAGGLGNGLSLAVDYHSMGFRHFPNVS